ncbi:tetratricopeptide repeat protein [Methanoregula sp.]|uniref:tetratricopeptide repeat protein n=1 Tax=Methanoregula sp. TaxID=2052170 RepID=UPI0023722A22|nr:tetratricopeptide repeat protein [Methanoregula sp.]MDD1687491.1 tetratricopeptide repeat protein [Methanoregula sp.]
MKLKWIILLVVVAIVGIFVVLPAVAPAVTEKTVVRDAQVSLGDTFAIMNQSELAISMYDNALSVNATDAVILKKKGEMLIKTGRVNEAETVYRQVLSQDGSDTTALMRAGDSLVRQGSLNEALSYYDAALAVNPMDSKIWMRKGDTYLIMSVEENKKLQAAAKALSVPLSSPNYQPSSAIQYESMQSYKEAMASYQKAMEIDPKLSVMISARILTATQNQVAGYQDLLKNF